MVSVFVFWRSGASAHVEVSIWFFVWAFCPSVVSLFFLVAVVGNCPLLLVVAVGVSLLGVSALAVGVGVFVDWCSGAWPALGFGVCLLALWDFCPPCGVRLPLLGGCGLGLVFVFRLFGVSARSGVFIFPLVVVVGALGLLPALLCFFFLLVAVVGICPSVPVPCWFRLLGPFFSSLVWAT